jgi:transcriptional regulator with XRE-family HTH domain
MADFAERLLELRKSKNLSQQALAEVIGLSKSIISMYERGERLPSYEAQEALADYFNVDIDFLTGRHDKTTVVFPAVNGNPRRRYLMDRIAKADDKKLAKFEKLMEIIDDEQNGHIDD